MENAAKEGAIYGAQNPVCDTDANPTLCPDPSNVEWHVLNEASYLSDVTVAEIQCLDSVTGIPKALRTCLDGDTYRVVAEEDFRLLTPIIGAFFGESITLRSVSTAVVLNVGFDPTPGLGVTKEACFGAGCTPSITPTTDADNNLIYLEGMSGDTITYLVRIRNIGGSSVSNVTVTDELDGAPFGLPGGCPPIPNPLLVAASGNAASRSKPP